MTILPQLERDLFEAAKERLPAAGLAHGPGEHPHGRKRLPRPAGFGHPLAAAARALPTLLAIGVTVSIGAFALFGLHHGRLSRPVTPAGTVQSARAQLIQMLDVLRRPQSKADLDPELVPGFLRIASIPEQLARRHKAVPAGVEQRLAQWGQPELDRALVRAVEIPAWHAKVGIETVTWQPSPASSRRSEGLALELWIGSKSAIPPSSDEGTGLPPASADVVREHGLALADSAPDGNLMDGILLVPDGVASVRLRLIRIVEAPVSVSPSAFGSATAEVQNNIAAFQLSLPTVVSRGRLSGMFGTRAVAQVTWFRSDGSVIRHTTTNLDVLIRVGKTKLPPRQPPGQSGAKR